MIKLLNICDKNIKITLRNWSYILFLVIGPAVLIFLTGFTMGQANIKYVKIGVISTNDAAINDFLQEMDKETNILKYANLYDCVEALKNSQIALCMKFDKLSTKSETPTFLITSYYDNTKVSLSSIAINFLEKRIHEKEKELTTESISSMLGEMASFSSVITDTQQFIADSKIQLAAAKEQMVLTKEALDAVKTTFDAKYRLIKEVQPKVNSDSAEAIKTINDIDLFLGEVEANSDSIALNADSVSSSLSPEQLAIVQGYLSSMKLSSQSIKSKIADYRKSVQASPATIESITDEFNSMVELMESVNVFLNSTTSDLDNLVQQIDNSLERIDQIDSEVSQVSDKFSGIMSSQISSTTPIVSLLKPLFEEAGKLNLFFPTLLVLTISFLGVFLANIFIINETESDGYIRNFLTPVNDKLFILGSFIVIMLLVIFQIMVLLVIAKYNFGIDVFSNFLSLMIAALLISTIFVELGMVFGYLFKSVHLSILSSTFLVLALFLFSGIIFPYEAMPSAVNFAVNMNPLVFGESLLRKVFFTGMFVFNDTINIIKSAVFIILLTTAVVMCSNLKKRRV